MTVRNFKFTALVVSMISRYDGQVPKLQDSFVNH